jgi:iron-sulfur cluster assembly accessory protein
MTDLQSETKVELSKQESGDKDYKAVLMTPAAIAAGLRMAKDDVEHQGKALRLYLEGKGCDGFYYGVTFDETLDFDIQYEYEGVRLVVDRDTIEFVEGSTIDWIDDERGQGFMVHNPRQSLYRGKFFKRPSWQKTRQ